jgi:DNA repair exonuclease SbcCD nuclease subunit
LKAFSFIHASDLHLGYTQYGLEARRQDFDKAFMEIVEKTLELKPDFMIIAGDIFHKARPSNITLENAIRCFKHLRDAGIPVLTVDGSHDSEPNTITGTILYPLDSAGLIYHLPRHEGACWNKAACCYVYGVPNFRSRRKTEEALPAFMAKKPPTPNPKVSNICVFHMAVDLPNLKPPYIEAEAQPELIPNGFDYYAAGHIHKRFMTKFKTGFLVYSGCSETVSYDEFEQKKGFFHVRVNEKGKFSPEFVELSSPRKFAILEQEYSGMTPAKITELASKLVKGADQEGVIIIPVLKGVLPTEARRAEVNITGIKKTAKKALLVHPIVMLKESVISDEIVRSIFESEFKDLKTKVYEYFLQIFSERYGAEEAEKIARSALSLTEPLTKKQEKKVKETIEELLG